MQSASPWEEDQAGYVPHNDDDWVNNLAAPATANSFAQTRGPDRFRPDTFKVQAADQKFKILNEIRQQENELARLAPEAQRLRVQRQKLQQQYQERVENIEARLLTADILPVSEGHRQHYKRHHHHAPPAPQEPEPDVDPLLADPSLPRWLPEQLQYLPELPEGSRVIGYKKVGGSAEAEAGFFKTFEEPEAMGQKKPEEDDYQPGPMAKGPYIDSNQSLTLPGFLPVGPFAEKGYMDNVYPMMRMPMLASRGIMVETDLQDFLDRKDYYEAPQDMVDRSSFPFQYRQQLEEAGPHGQYVNEIWWRDNQGPVRQQLKPVTVSRMERAVVNTCATVFRY